MPYRKKASKRFELTTFVYKSRQWNHEAKTPALKYLAVRTFIHTYIKDDKKRNTNFLSCRVDNQPAGIGILYIICRHISSKTWGNISSRTLKVQVSDRSWICQGLFKCCIPSHKSKCAAVENTLCHSNFFTLSACSLLKSKVAWWFYGIKQYHA